MFDFTMDLRAWCSLARTLFLFVLLGLTSTQAYALCGDGVVDLGEDCDDGNGLNCDGCTNLCSIGPDLEMVLISGGTFMMGDEGYRASRNVHEVSLADFEVSRHEVTVEQYRRCVDSGGCSAPARRSGCQYTDQVGPNDRRPVNCVSRSQAQGFVEWCMEGVPTDSPRMSLPTEAQWEYIAQSSGGPYPTGEYAPTNSEAHVNQRRGQPVDVCTVGSADLEDLRVQTLHQLCDVSGNVMEWLEDNYRAPYSAQHPTDGSALEVTTGRARDYFAIRGADYTTRRANQLRGAYRMNSRGSVQSARLGFRVACQEPGCVQGPQAVCGDGVTEGDEGCDDGNTSTELCAYGEQSCVVCASDCVEQAGQVTGYCGDGVLNGLEVCDGELGCASDCVSLTAPAPCASAVTGCPDLDFVAIEGGSFVMGTDTGSYSHGPAHPVTVPSFEVMRSHVTVGMWKLCVNAGACVIPCNPSSVNHCNYVDGFDDHPVNYVTWHDMMSFAAWVGARLLTEAEYEYAARGQGQEILYPWGDTYPSDCTYADFNNCDGDGTSPVCSHVNGYTTQGLCDMSGNLLVWIMDEFIDYRYDGAPADGSGWCTGVCPVNADDPNYSSNGGERRLRGSPWYHSPSGMHVFARENYSSSSKNSYVGGRLAR